jgi:toxin CptA
MSTQDANYRTLTAREPSGRLRLSLRPSARLGAVLGAGHAGALVIAAAMLPASAAVPAVVALGLSWLDAHRRHVARSAADAVTALELSAGEHLVVHQRSGASQAGPFASRFVSPALVVLTLRPPGHWRTIPVVILADAVGADEHRRLRVWLKWSRARADNPGAA